MSVIMDKLRKDVTPNAWHTVVDTRQHALRSIYYIFSRHREIVHVEGFTSLAAAACAGADHESPAHCIPQC